MYLVDGQLKFDQDDKELNTKAIFEIQRLNIEESQWDLEVYTEISPFFQRSSKEKKVCPNVSEQLKDNLDFIAEKNWSKPFRSQISIKGVTFLIAFFPEEKTCRVVSHRLSYELFAVKSVDQYGSSIENHIHMDDFAKFKDFVSSVASLSPLDFPSVIDEVTFKYRLEDPNDSEVFKKASEDSKSLTKKLLEKVSEYRPSLFEKFSDFALGLTAQYALVRVHVLKFLAVLPSLDHDKKGDEVKRMLLEAFRRLIEDNRKAYKLGKKGDERALPSKYIFLFKFLYSSSKLVPEYLLAKIVRFKVRTMARRFIAGENIEGATKAFDLLYRTKRDVTVDQLGELVVSSKEADIYCDEIIKIIEGFHLHVPRSEKNAAGINRAHVSIKVSALCSDFKPEAFEYTYGLVSERLKKILLAGKENDVFINIDAEHYDYRDVVFKVYEKVLLDNEELHDFAATGIVIQAYLRDAPKHFIDVLNLAKKRKVTMPIRLVKGAYWDAETIEADAHGHIAPEFLNKEETDIHFRQLIIETLKASPHLQLCLASHNYSDHAFAKALQEKQLPDSLMMEHQCLHMTYEGLSTALSKMGWPVRNYVPIGSLLVGMAYLVRRIMENSSQVGVLTIMRSHKKISKVIEPEVIHKDKIKSGERTLDLSISSMSDDFINVTPNRLYVDDEKYWVANAYDQFKATALNQEYKNESTTGEEVQIMSSSSPEVCVGKINFATISDANRALDQLEASYLDGKWSKTPWVYRSLILSKAAFIMSCSRSELSALITYEAGKSVSESLADVDEAIDFINFYARQNGKVHKFNPEVVSRGVGAVIAPWNFPFAIPCGMTVSSLITGNSTVLKSAEQTPLIAQKLCEILWQAGVPKDVLVHLPGEGESVGKALVEDPRVAQVIFTGSKNVGVAIHRQVSNRVVTNKLYDLQYPASVITEMGGKNAIIVTANAEPDETVAGILYSAFSHAGQKCSAASRIIVEKSIKDRLIERLAPAIEDLNVCEGFNFSCEVNPVISEFDHKRLKRQIGEAALEASRFGGRVITDRSKEDLPGFCVGPAVFEVSKIRAMHKDSYALKELFGPVCHIIEVDNLDEALEVFNSTPYALTGGIFSQSQDDIDYLSARMECGNIYVNRSITGARVAIEPFGGFKLSGTGPKAGGKMYLPKLYLNPFNLDIPGAQKTPDNEKGSEYQFDLCVPSGLNPTMRQGRMIKSLNEMVLHFEAFYQGLYSENKDTLVNFRKWVGNHFLDFYSRRHWNRRIPGQLSYNDISLVGEHCVVVSFEQRPYFQSLMEVLSAMLMGAGVTVVARNNLSYRWWALFKNLMARNGFSKQNFDVYFATEEILIDVLKNPMLSHLVIDGPIEKTKEIMELRKAHQVDPKRMCHLITPNDGPNVEDFKRLCNQYAWMRSFAVNTIRHGAPLDLQLEGR